MTTVVSFYTPDWDYPLYAERLREDCDRLGLKHHIVEKPSENNYVRNCNLKPFFIRDMLELVKGPVLWVDVDGSIANKPALLLSDEVKDYDIAGNRSQRDNTKVHVGSLLFNYTETTVALVNEWCNLVSDNGIDDGVFNEVWTKFADKIKFYELPPEYFVILKWPHSPIPEGSYIVHRLSGSDLKRAYKQQTEAVK